MLFVILLGLIIIVPLLFEIEEVKKNNEITPVEMRVREKFDLLRDKDSLALWDENRSWIFELNYNTTRDLSEYIKTTNYQYRKEKFRLRYKWYNFYTKKRLKLNFDLPKDIFYSSEYKRESIRDFSKYLRRIDDYLYNDFFLYSEFYKQDKDFLKLFAEQFRKLPGKTTDRRTELVYNVITFIQSMPYIKMREYNIDADTLVYAGTSGGRNGSERSGSYENAPVFPKTFKSVETGKKIKHEVFSPVEFLKYGVGDCDSRTIFAFTILKNLGYDVATMRIHYYEDGESSWHSMLGIAGVKNDGENYFVFQAKKYYYVELTKTNWRIGELTPDQKKFGRMIGLDMPLPKLQWGAL